MTTVIDMDSVSKFYGQVMGLNDVTLKFNKGLTGLLGPNGAGKSTMMKIITGQIKASKGSVSGPGMSPWDNPRLNLKIGYCPEQDSFFRDMTGIQFISFCQRLNGTSKKESEDLALEAVKKVDMKEHMNRPISQYSKGMRQRIKIGQALVHDPELLILDEPLAGTDPIGRMKIIELLFDLLKEGRHIVVSSHVLHEVERLTENIILIDRGKLVAGGKIQEIRDSLDKFPLTIRLRTPEPRRIGRILIDNAEISSINFGEKDEVLLRTKDPNLFFTELQKIIVKEKLKILSIDSPDDDLNAIFEYLVE